MRFAAIDIGSNAVRLLISEIVEHDNLVDFVKKQFIRVPLRLGENAFQTKKISAAKTKELVKTLLAFKNLMEVYQVDKYMACATAAMREARNRDDVIANILRETGLKVEVIEGKKEAEIIYTNHIAESLNKNKAYMYIDVGGGSTELTLFNAGKVIASNSFKIGTIRILLNQNLETEWKSVKEWLKLAINTHKKIVGIGTGGNINKLSKMIEQPKKDSKLVRFEDLKSAFHYLSNYSIEDRINYFGMNEDRADVIIPAAGIFLTIMKWAKMDELLVPRLGLADGIIHHLYEKHYTL